MPAHPELLAHPVYKEDLGKRKSMDTEQLQQDAEKALEREQSHTAKLLEHHLKLQQLERKLTYTVTRLDEAEERRREATKALTIFLAGVCYGLVLVWIFSS